MSKPIKAWKGGRTARLSFRVTPAIKQELFALAAQHECTVSDLLLQMLDAFKEPAPRRTAPPAS